jgi:hypothetical protein
VEKNWDDDEFDVHEALRDDEEFAVDESGVEEELGMAMNSTRDEESRSDDGWFYRKHTEVRIGMNGSYLSDMETIRRGNGGKRWQEGKSGGETSGLGKGSREEAERNHMSFT